MFPFDLQHPAGYPQGGGPDAEPSAMGDGRRRRLLAPAPADGRDVRREGGVIFQLKNTGPNLYAGPHRTVVDPAFCPTHARGRTRQGARWALGRTVSENSRILDLELKLPPGSSLAFDTDKDFATADPWTDAPLPVDPINFFGVPECNGVPLNFLSLVEDGAHLCVAFRARFSAMNVGLLLLRYWPGQAIAVGTWNVYCSNPSLPDMTASLAFALKMGNNEVTLGAGAPQAIGDGQVWRIPVAVAFASDAVTGFAAQAQARRLIVGHGLRKVGVTGLYDQARFDPVYWTGQMTARMWANLSGYDLPPLGCEKNSASTGDQEEQGCEQGKESFYPGGLGGEVPRYLSALGHGRQPCHYLRADGSMQMPEDAPRALMWSGRPLWESRNADSTAQDHDTPSWPFLGKPRQLDIARDTAGWFGPDVEHALIHDLAAGYELTGEDALLDELRHRARNWLWEMTVDPKWTTSLPWAARARGWKALEVMELARLLPKDDPLRQQVVDRWKLRHDTVDEPSWRRSGVWDGALFPANFELQGRYPLRAFTYQVAIAAYGLWQCGKVVGHQPAQARAAVLADAVVRFGYQTLPTGWTEWEMIGANGDGTCHDWMQEPFTEGLTGHRTGFYRCAWMPLALHVVLESGYGDVSKAQALRDAALNTYRANFNSHDPLGNFPADWFPVVDPKAVKAQPTDAAVPT